MREVHRILIVDDYSPFRDCLRAFFTEDSQIEVIGEAENGREAIQATGKLKPDLVLIDVTMPVMNGIVATREIKRKYPEVRVLVMTMHKLPGYAKGSLSAGADGFILKDATREDYCIAIDSVMRGNGYWMNCVVASGPA
jgi:DNA-binding NarL/FixJ family response regulator